MVATVSEHQQESADQVKAAIDAARLEERALRDAAIDEDNKQAERLANVIDAEQNAASDD